MRFPQVAGLVAFLATTTLFPASGRADEVAACVKASEDGQQLRDDGKYKRAREQFVMCSRDACPGIVKKDCTEWLQALDRSTPSVVVGARDAAGKDLVDVKVMLDGQPFVTKLDGKPLPVDPGAHTMRYEAAGSPPVEEQVVIHAGEKNRPLMVRFAGPAAPPEAPRTVPGPPAPSGGSGGVPTAAIVVGAIGVVALGSFTFFGITGKGDVSDLRSSGCAPNCDPAKVDAARNKLILADISLGVGVVALGVATWMVLANMKTAPTGVTTGLTHVDVRAVAGGGVAEIGARF
jgi:hypothetical protein